ncbi:MAG: hypothetical protein O3A57_09255 [Bacteroidetes bacterium]|nr:hypothetical protein [Bacteroidota bacterium]
MEPRRLGSEGGLTPSFVRPFLYALNRMQANEVLRPSQYMDRSRSILTDRLGAAGGQPITTFSRGCVGVIADHTHYFKGFALLLRLHQGLAVSMRRHQSGRSRLVIEGVPDVIQFDISDAAQSGFAGLLASLFVASEIERGLQVDISIVGAIPTGLGAAFHAACAVSVLEALHQVAATEASTEKPSLASESFRTQLRDQSIQGLATWYGHRFSPAYVIGTLASDDIDSFILVDTGTLEFLPIEIESSSRPGWAIIETSHDWTQPMKASVGRFEAATKALAELQKKAFPNVSSLRDLEHRDLERAVSAVGRKSRPVLKHLVSENRNVQKMVLALRKGDWQFFGALMFISQASKQQDWNTSGELHDLMTRSAESASLDGIFGVVQTGEGGCMLVAGQPFSLPAFLDSVREATTSHTTEEIETFII